MKLSAAKWELAANREALNKSMETARLTALEALDAGMTEVDVAKHLGVNRMTVRKWAGK